MGTLTERNILKVRLSSIAKTTDGLADVDGTRRRILSKIDAAEHTYIEEAHRDYLYLVKDWGPVTIRGSTFYRL